MIPNLTPSTKCKECKSRQRGAARSGSGIKFKLLKSRPSRLQTVPRAPQETDSESEDDWIGYQKDRQEESEQEVGGGEENDEAAGEAQNSSPIAHRTRNKTDRSKQPSPRERKKRKVQAQQRRIGDWTIKETEEGWRRAREEEEEMLDKY